MDFEDTYVQEFLHVRKNQVNNHSKIDYYVNNQKSKTLKSNLSKDWKEKRYNMLVLSGLIDIKVVSIAVFRPMFKVDSRNIAILIKICTC